MLYYTGAKCLSILKNTDRMDISSLKFYPSIMKTTTSIFLTGLISALSFAACTPQPTDPQTGFLANLSALCGQSFAGKVVSADPQDADWAKETLIMHVRDCSEDEIKIPLHVGENRSRTWIITRQSSGLELKHDDRHEDPP